MRYLTFAVLLLFACGTEKCKTPDLTDNPTVWQGYADQYQNGLLMQAREEVISCLSNIDPNIIHNESIPYVVTVQNEIPRQDGLLHNGCYAGCNDTIYVKNSNLISYFTLADNNNIMYSVPIASDLFKHELIHQITGLGDEYHSTPYFMECQ